MISRVLVPTVEQFTRLVFESLQSLDRVGEVRLATMTTLPSREQYYH